MIPRRNKEAALFPTTVLVFCPSGCRSTLVHLRTWLSRFGGLGRSPRVKKPCLKHWEGPLINNTMWSFAPLLPWLAWVGSPFLPLCAAGDCLISSVFCSPREFHPRQTQAMPAMGYPHTKQRSFIKLLLQMGLPLGRVKWPVTVHAAEVFLSNTGPLGSKLWLRLPGWPWPTCLPFSMLHVLNVDNAAAPLLPVWQSSCVSDIPAEIRAFLCYSNRNKWGASAIQPPHLGLLAQTPPLLPCVYGDEQETNQKTSKTKDGLCLVWCKPRRGSRQSGVIWKFWV